MARPIAHIYSRLGRVACHFGFTMGEVAALLGISAAQASQIAAGARNFTPEVSQRLEPFLDALDTAPAVATASEAPAGPFDPAPLKARRAACLHEAGNLRWRCRPLAAQAQVAAHWAAARPGLLAVLPPAPAEPATAEAVRLRYVHARLALAADALPPAEVATWHLLRLRADALEAEAAALDKLLSAPGAVGH